MTQREYIQHFHKWNADEAQEKLQIVEGTNPYNPGIDFKYKTELYLQFCDMVEWHLSRCDFPYAAARVNAKSSAVRKELGHGINKSV